jgi:hypothetical protein
VGWNRPDKSCRSTAARSADTATFDVTVAQSVVVEESCSRGTWELSPQQMRCPDHQYKKGFESDPQDKKQPSSNSYLLYLHHCHSCQGAWIRKPYTNTHLINMDSSPTLSVSISLDANDTTSRNVLVDHMSPVSRSIPSRGRSLITRLEADQIDVKAPGVQCQTCAGRGAETWVIPGKLCHVCGTPC